MKLRNARVGEVVGTHFRTTSEEIEYRLTYGQILEVWKDAIVVKWDDISGEVVHNELDLRSIFIDRKY